MAADVLSNVNGYGLASAKPTAPLAEGYIYFSTDTGVLERYSGSAWESIASGSSSAWPYNHPASYGIADHTYHDGLASYKGMANMTLKNATDSDGSLNVSFDGLRPCNFTSDAAPVANAGVWAGSAGHGNYTPRWSQNLYSCHVVRFHEQTDMCLFAGFTPTAVCNSYTEPAGYTAADNRVACYAFFKPGDTYWSLVVRNGAGAGVYTKQISAIAPTTGWVVIEIYMNAGKADLYIDGVLAATIEDANVPTLTTTSRMYCGAGLVPLNNSVTAAFFNSRLLWFAGADDLTYRDTA